MLSGDLSFSDIDPRTLLEKTTIRIGYPSLDRANADVLKKIEAIVAACEPVICGRFMHRAIPYTGSRRGVVCGEDGFRIESPKLAWLARSMTGVDHILCLALTVGTDMDERIRRAAKVSVLDSVIWDGLGSCIAEAFADEVQHRIAGECAQSGLMLSARFSPGYCDWPMAIGQQAIFRVLDPAVIGIRVSPASGLMVPRKSISAVILAASGITCTTPCPHCRKTDCDHRRYPPIKNGPHIP